MSYIRSKSGELVAPGVRRSLSGGPPPVFNLPGGWPGGPGGLPGPIQLGPAPPGISMPVTIFPRNVRWGDPITVSGPFAAMAQGQVLVRFVGAPAQGMAMMGPGVGSVQVPVGAESGVVTVEVNGRQAGSAHVTVTPAAPVLSEPRGHKAWKNVGMKMGRFGSYEHDRDSASRGAGAIAAIDGRRSRRLGKVLSKRTAVSYALDRAKVRALGMLGRFAQEDTTTPGETGPGGGGGGMPGGRFPRPYKPPHLMRPGPPRKPLAPRLPFRPSWPSKLPPSAPLPRPPEQILPPYGVKPPVQPWDDPVPVDELEVTDTAPAAAGKPKTLLYLALGVGAYLLFK